MKSENLTGQRFNRLIVIGKCEPKTLGSRTYVTWLCKCDCGNETKVITSGLKRGITKSCGCLNREQLSKAHIKDLTGKVFGELTVLERVLPNSSTNKIRYKCKCSCGNDTIVIGADMVNKKVISCGCKWKSRIKAKGDSHFAWNSNLSDEDRNNKRHIYHYNEWRFSVYKRDNFTCRACGSKKSGNFHAHHILNYHNNPHKRVCIDNGITLCKDCHSNFHHIYGYRENNMEQLKEFLKGKLNGSNLN